MKEKYVDSDLKIYVFENSDVVTASIPEDTGENDGEWME